MSDGLGCNNCYACISGGRKPCLNEKLNNSNHISKPCLAKPTLPVVRQKNTPASEQRISTVRTLPKD